MPSAGASARCHRGSSPSRWSRARSSPEGRAAPRRSCACPDTAARRPGRGYSNPTRPWIREISEPHIKRSAPNASTTRRRCGHRSTKGYAWSTASAGRTSSLRCWGFRQVQDVRKGFEGWRLARVDRRLRQTKMIDDDGQARMTRCDFNGCRSSPAVDMNSGSPRRSQAEAARSKASSGATGGSPLCRGSVRMIRMPTIEVLAANSSIVSSRSGATRRWHPGRRPR